MNPLNTIKGTLIAGLVLSVVLTVAVKWLANVSASPAAPAAAELPVPDLGPATQDQLNAPAQEVGPVEGEEVITE